MPLSRRAPSGALFLSFVSVAAWAVSCSAGGDFQPGGGASSGSGGHGGGGLIVDGGGGAGGGLPDPDAACGLITEQAKATPLNLYIAFDKSSSMVGEKWTSATAGLNAFVSDPASDGVTVALNFFPGSTPTCDQTTYKSPAVAFGPLPQNAMAIATALAAMAPDGFQTPIYPALGGAILASKEQALNHPGQAASVLLVTDGDPQGPASMCGGVNPEDPQVIADLAKTGTGFGVKTFVIGLEGVKQSTVNLIAKAGGTDAAILVGSVNVQAEFQEALAKVRGQALPCAYDVPEKVEGGEIDVGLVNILLTPGGGKPATLPQSPACSGDGWKYDDPANPKHIVLCPSSCKALKLDFSAKVQILLGCKTEVAK
jgi:hypothetical protein